MTVPLPGEPDRAALPPVSPVLPIRVRGLTAQTTILVFIAITIFFFAIRSVLLPFVVAGAVAYATTPAVEWLRARTGLPRTLSAIITFLLLLGIVGGLAWASLPSALGQIWALLSDLEANIRSAAHAVIGDSSVVILGKTVTAAEIGTNGAEVVRDWIGGTGRVAVIVTWAFSAVAGLFITLVLLFYFLVSGPWIVRGLHSLLPPRERPIAMAIWLRLDPLMKRYFVGVFILMAYAGIAAWVGLGLVLGLPEAVLLAIVTGLLEIIPVIGPIASGVLAGVVALPRATGAPAVIALALYITVFRISIDQVIAPIILGRAGYINPALIVFSFLAGGLLFGVSGVIMAVPVALAIRTSLTIIYEAQERALEGDALAGPAADGR